MLMTSMLCQTVAGTAFARIHVGAVQRMGGSQQVRRGVQAFEIEHETAYITFRVDFRFFGWVAGW